MDFGLIEEVHSDPQAKGSSTSGHFENFHKRLENVQVSGSSQENESKRQKKIDILSYMQKTKTKPSLNEKVSCMFAEDHFNQISSSNGIRKSFNALGYCIGIRFACSFIPSHPVYMHYHPIHTSLPFLHLSIIIQWNKDFNVETQPRLVVQDSYDIPRSHKGVKACMFRFYELAIKQVKLDIDKKIEKGIWFSITLDEYTSIQIRRYLNINIHFAGGFYNLGLVRVFGTMTVVEKCLHEFGIDPSRHVCAAVTDGAQIMPKFA